MEYIIRNSDKEQKGDITRNLQRILSQCRNNGEENIIRFEKGEYHFYADFCEDETVYASNTDSERFPLKKTAINICGHKNLTFDGGDSLFIMHGKMIAVKVTDSENITLKNFTWDFPCAGTLEMKLIRKGRCFADYQLPEKTQWQIKGKTFHWFEKSVFGEGDYWHYKEHKDSYCIVVSDEEKGSLCRYGVNFSPFAFSVGLKKLAENVVRVYSLSPASKKFREGITFEICPDKNRDCLGAFYLDSKNISAENITARYMHGFSWLIQMCENVTFVNCDFTPDENSDRKCTSFADHLHFSGVKGKVHIESCNFSNAHDDPINIHGTFTVVKKKIDDCTLLCEYCHNQQRGFVQYHSGDEVMFYLRDNLQSYKEKAFTVDKVINPLCEGLSAEQMIVTFTEKLPDEICEKDRYAIENITYTPDVYIGGCRFSHIPTRGILCTTRGNVIIENNVFDGLTMAGIYLSNDCNNWYESGEIHNMIIRDNIFYVRKSDGFSGSKPAIFIEPIVKNENSDVCVHRNITVENNCFYLEHSNALEGKLTENLVIKNNKLISICSEKVTAFRVSSCKNVVIEGNEGDENIIL